MSDVRERPVYHYPHCRHRYDYDGPDYPACTALDASIKHGTIWPELAVDAIVADLQGRRGIKWEWEKIDEDVKDEIRKTWVGIIRKASRSK